jgi:AcrR family transcriptional regulator
MAALRRRAKKPLGPGHYDRTLTRSERLAEQRQRLIEAATDVFARRGYSSASVEVIVRRAHMSRRTFYEHFDDLSDALLAVYDYASTMLFNEVDARVQRANGPIDKVRAGVGAYLEQYAENADLARVLAREIRAAGPKHALRHQKTLARFADLISVGVAEAFARGLAGRPPDELTVYALVAGIEAAGMRYLERGEETRLHEAAPKLVELVVRAFR